MDMLTVSRFEYAMWKVSNDVNYLHRAVNNIGSMYDVGLNEIEDILENRLEDRLKNKLEHSGVKNYG